VCRDSLGATLNCLQIVSVQVREQPSDAQMENSAISAVALWRKGFFSRESDLKDVTHRTQRQQSSISRGPVAARIRGKKMGPWVEGGSATHAIQPTNLDKFKSFYMQSELSSGSLQRPTEPQFILR